MRAPSCTRGAGRGVARARTASAHLANAQALAHGRANTTAAAIDVKDDAALDALIAAHDLVIRSALAPRPAHADPS